MPTEPEPAQPPDHTTSSAPISHPGDPSPTPRNTTVAIDMNVTNAQAGATMVGMAVEHLNIIEEQSYNVTKCKPNPYFGLSAYTYDDRLSYAGRSAEVEAAKQCITKLGEQRALHFITGASGSGKSSFVQAGLLPALEAVYQGYNLSVQHAKFQPSNTPLVSLAGALMELGVPASGPFASTALYMLTAPSPPQHVSLLVVDQFEELFTQADLTQPRPASIFTLKYAHPCK